MRPSAGGSCGPLDLLALAEAARKAGTKIRELSKSRAQAANPHHSIYAAPRLPARGSFFPAMRFNQALTLLPPSVLFQAELSTASHSL
jgi:hypothetical protein